MPDPVRALGVAALAMLSASVPSSAAKTHDDNTAALTRMLARYDAMKPGAARDKLATEIDAFAHQRYATVSRLYWYTDLDAAKAAATSQHRPILHLRMLGRLDEDLSCANSRFFRTTLYANAETSKFLRDNFVLYWSTERPVPRVTIDYGDGRQIVRTTTGNSAHYVMDAAGNVLDALPGLYAPLVFRAELAKSLALAKQVDGLDRILRDEKLAAFHTAETERVRTAFAKLANLDYVARAGRLIGRDEVGASAVARAQRASMTKMAVETVDLRKIGIDAGAVDPADIMQWATIGQQLWNIGLAKDQAQTQARASRTSFYPAPMLLDPPSIALVTSMRAGNPLAMQPEALLARLEQHIVADTAQNELAIRTLIRAHIGRGLDFDKLNAYVYSKVFHTPKEDAWLGLLDSTDFTGLPADGVVMP